MAENIVETILRSPLAIDHGMVLNKGGKGELGPVTAARQG